MIFNEKPNPNGNPIRLFFNNKLNTEDRILMVHTGIYYFFGKIFYIFGYILAKGAEYCRIKREKLLNNYEKKHKK